MSDAVPTFKHSCHLLIVSSHLILQGLASIDLTYKENMRRQDSMHCMQMLAAVRPLDISLSLSQHELLNLQKGNLQRRKPPPLPPPADGSPAHDAAGAKPVHTPISALYSSIRAASYATVRLSQWSCPSASVQYTVGHITCCIPLPG